MFTNTKCVLSIVTIEIFDSYIALNDLVLFLKYKKYRIVFVSVVEVKHV